jgi:hypothetical protein
MFEDRYDCIPSGNIVFGLIPDEYLEKLAVARQETIRKQKIEADLALEALRNRGDLKSKFYLSLIYLRLMSPN